MSSRSASRWASGGGGGTTYTVGVASAYVTAGDITLPNTSGAWQTLAGIPSLALAAAVGDHVTVEWAALRSEIGTGFLDVAIVVGGSHVWYASSGTGTPAVEGDPGWYGANAFHPHAGAAFLTLTSDHVSGGNVTFVVAVKAAGSGTLYASSSYPFRWRAMNHGAPA